jgi:imidazolonepropionase-like amidohydrolase
MKIRLVLLATVLAPTLAALSQEASAPPPQPLVLHAARLFDVTAGRIVAPGEVLVEGDRIRAAGSSVPHPPGTKTIDRSCRG